MTLKVGQKYKLNVNAKFSLFDPIITIVNRRISWGTIIYDDVQGRSYHVDGQSTGSNFNIISEYNKPKISRLPAWF